MASQRIDGTSGNDFLTASNASGSSTYRVVDGSFTWEQAKADAEAKGGHLATITSEEEWSKIVQSLGDSLKGKNLWLGATDAEQEGNWKWITGEAWGYTRWQPGEPNNCVLDSSTDEDYLHAFGYEDASQRWNDLPNQPLAFSNGYSAWDFYNGRRGDLNYLLEVEGGAVGGNTSLFGGAGNDTLLGGGGNDTLEGGDGDDLITAGGGTGGSTYRFVEGSLTWEQAKADAEAKGGHLGTITSAEEWSRISLSLGENVSSYIMWLGGSQHHEAQSPTSDWYWVTGEKFDYANWADGEPNGTYSQGFTEDHILLNWFEGYTKGSWVDARNDEQNQGYLLETERASGSASGNNSLSGGAGNDTLQGAAGNDSLDGGTGADALAGGAGDDVYIVDDSGDLLTEDANAGTDAVFSSLTYTLGANLENLTLTGKAALNGVGNTQDNQITGNPAANKLDGSTGADTLVGGAGNDTYIVDDAGDVVTEGSSEGTDTVLASVSYTLGDNVENLTLTGTAALNARGNTLANSLTGNGAANLLFGGGGNDTLAGGAGNDTLNAGTGLDTVKGDAGSDLLQIDWSGLAGATVSRSIRKDGAGTTASYSGSYTAKNSAGAVLSAVTFEGIESLSLNGKAVDLNASVAAPGVTLKRSSKAVSTTEQGGLVQYSVVLDKAPFEDVTLQFTSSDLTEGKVTTPSLVFTPKNWATPQTLTIQGQDDYLDDGNIAYSVNGKIVTGDLAYNRLTLSPLNLLNNDDTEDKPINFKGTADVDYFQGKNGDDRIYGGADQDQLKGGRGDDRIYGQDDNDRLFGELGNDELYGGYDDDTLDGGEGSDSLFGEQGRDTLIGGAGNDYLDGGLLNDSMSGGAGNDTYLVDSTGDVINDLGLASDVDTVQVIQTISYTLPVNIENAAITANGNANLTGNLLNNGLNGNDGKNVLDGGVGNDTLDGSNGADNLLGGVGNDDLIGGAGNDSLRGGAGVDLADFADSGVDMSVNLALGRATGEGTDTISEVENILSGEGNDTLTGSTLGNDLEAGVGFDYVNGGDGSDTLSGCVEGANGGRGDIDTLIGGAGADVFQLGWAGGRFYDDGNVKTSGKTDYVLITDFTPGQDKLQLDGAAGGYYLAASGVGGASGIGLFAEQGATDELLAIIKSANATVLRAENTLNTAVFV